MAEDMAAAAENVRRAYESFNRQDFDAAAALLHPEVEFVRIAEVEKEPLRGREAVREFFTPDVFESQHLELNRVETIGDFVLVDATVTNKGAQSGVEISQRGHHLWRVKDGKAISFRYFLDRDEAVEAARTSRR